MHRWTVVDVNTFRRVVVAVATAQGGSDDHFQLNCWHSLATHADVRLTAQIRCLFSRVFQDIPLGYGFTMDACVLRDLPHRSTSGLVQLAHPLTLAQAQKLVCGATVVRAHAADMFGGRRFPLTLGMPVV